MRIVVNDIAASYGGALTILRQFYEYIRGHDSDNEWIFILSEPHIEETDRIKVLLRPDIKASGLKKLLFDLFTGRYYIDSLEPDVVLSLQNIITFGVKAPQLTYIHQSIPFADARRFSLLKRDERATAVYQRLIGRIIKASAQYADGVIVQTEWMREAVAEQSRTGKAKIIAARPDIPPLPDASRYIPFNGSSFFCPTNGEVYKNIGAVTAACRALRREGITDFRVALTLEQGSVNDPNIDCIGYQDRVGMAHRYASSVLLFPSYIETIGLPLAEARRFGAPIIAADRRYARETLEGYDNAYYFDPFAPCGPAELMKSAVMGEMQRTDVNTENKQTPPAESGWKKVYEYILGFKCNKHSAPRNRR